MNVSYRLTTTDDAHFSSDIKFYFEVCEGSKIAPHCSFNWKRRLNEMTTVKWMPENKTTCFVNHRNISDLVFQFDIHISLLVKRSFNLMRFSILDSNHKFKILRLIGLDVLCKSRFLSVDYFMLIKDCRVYEFR